MIIWFWWEHNIKEMYLSTVSKNFIEKFLKVALWTFSKIKKWCLLKTTSNEVIIHYPPLNYKIVNFVGIGMGKFVMNNPVRFTSPGRYHLVSQQVILNVRQKLSQQRVCQWLLLNLKYAKWHSWYNVFIHTWY